MTSFLPDLSTQIFFLICVLGLFHGLLVLPVLLSLVGPPSRQPAIPTEKATTKSSLHQKVGDDQDIDRAHLQQDVQNVDPEITSDAINEITPLRAGGGGGCEEEEGLMGEARRGSSISLEDTGCLKTK